MNDLGVAVSSVVERDWELSAAGPAGGACPRRSLDMFADVQASETVVGQMFYPHSISVTRGSGRFEGTFKALEFGPFAMAELDYNVGLVMDVPSIHGYHLNMSLEAGLLSTTELKAVRSVPGTAALYRAGSHAELRTVSESTLKMFGLKISPQALEQTLSGLIGAGPDREAILFTGELDLSRGDGLRWWNLLMSVRGHWADNRLLNHPMVSEPLFQSVLAGLLLVARHQHSERLHGQPAGNAVPATVRIAEDYIFEHLSDPLTIVDIARFVNLSARSLQRAFLQHLETTPMQYVRARRLERVHAELLASDPSQVRVADVAARWGFTHLGRFAGDYRRVFGTSPRKTLYR